MNAPRRRLQFSLRTLLIAVTLVAIPCAYVGWQAEIVRQRKAERVRLESQGAQFWLGDNLIGPPIVEMGSWGWVPLYPQEPEQRPGWLRRLLGDISVDSIFTRSDIADRAKRVFPEAEVPGTATYRIHWMNLQRISP